uniref:Uncharacterized protein n=1 Tax=Setaria viridis TaxID=4556 RepID=A0A4U6VPT3_SETVI|nr:hypothetical protein SEVIR_3G198000v2 [Setaria viridis]
MPVPYAPHPTSFHPLSSWGWNDPWAHIPSYFRPYHVEYAAPREPSCARQPYVENDHFEQKDRSSVQKKKKVVKQVYRVKRDGHKDKSSNLNLINEKLISVLSTSAINSKKRKNQPLILQNYWSLHHPFALQMSYMSMYWNSSLDIFGYPSYSYFDPWMPHGSLYHGGLSANCCAY